jgi:molybdopterin-containing oxidoreductase family iron-sulfur binding subunit
MSTYDLVRQYWQAQTQAGDPSTGSGQSFVRFWLRALHDGVIDGTTFAPISVTLTPDFAQQLGRSAALPATGAGLELIFRPDPSIWDGRYANNGWLQELPKPLTTLTWDNAALISPRTAEQLGLATEDLVELHFRGRTQRAAILIQPGHADESVTLHLGYGRERGGRIAEGLGFNAYAIRPSDALWFGAGLEIRKLGERYQLAVEQHHHAIEGEEIVRAGTLEEFRQNPDFARHEFDELLPSAARKGANEEHELPSLYPEYRYDGHAWGMTIDLNACIGCNACTVACQAENNIPIVGKQEVMRGRIMHWLKVDRYYAGDLDTPETYFQPRPCMHCEKAPCEVVCPVVATVHDDEGINQMVYNRCVGTRYCSNNCPYKVRRFNFFDYAQDIPVINLMRNPDVTVRERGVMEKCTYCIQRIESARIEAKKEGRPIRDGEIQTACQQACPTNAIVFGDINDPDSAVSQLKALPLNYGLLAELGTQPRTTYLARLRNPNPELEDGR